MIEALNAASRLLQTAMEQYISACNSIQSCDIQGNWLSSIFSDCVANELSKIASYETKLRHAKTTLSMARNRCSAIVPIYTLPDELLIYIFHLVLSSQPCTAEVNGSEDTLFPKYPDLLSHVCSRWRHAAINSRNLWSHIDLAPCHTRYQDFVDRAAVCVARAGHLPLHLHVATLQYQIPKYTKSSHYTLEMFLESISSNILSLELVAGDKSDSEDTIIDLRVLESCLENCVPGTLTRLMITNNASDYLSFIYPHGFQDQDSFDGFILKISHEFLEDLWYHVMALQLYGMYPCWTSKAYHNLVELHLISRGDSNFTIPESHLVRILNSSPHLRIFHFDFVITDILPADASVICVHLDDLEVLVLSLSPVDSEGLGNLLRWFAPGSVPLQLSLARLYEVKEFMSNVEVRGFFTRSKITRLRLVMPSVSYQQIAELVGLLPDLDLLTLANSECFLNPNQLEASDICLDKCNTSVKPFPVGCLYMLRCECDLDGLQWLVGRGLVRTITLWECTFTQSQGISIVPVDVGQAFAYDLFSASPVVKLITGNKPSPIAIDDWDA